MKNSKSFTMAEILISLTIIGIIAAITLPSLRGNINERTWATQKKALYARMSQAVALLESTNSYVNAQSFITSGLSEVLKINNVCAQNALSDCGINTAQLVTAAGAPMSGGFPVTWASLGINSNWNSSAGISAASQSANNAAMVAAFETVNGESVAVFYNPDCVPDGDDSPSASTQPNLFSYVCANLVYDLNADKGPNTVGKDIGFMTIFYASDPVVASAIPSKTDKTAIDPADATKTCPDDYRIPNLQEAAAIQLNWNIIGGTAYDTMLTSGRAIDGSNTFIYKVNKVPSLTRVSNSTATGDTRCIKR